MLACCIDREYAYLTGEVRSVPIALAERFMREGRARKWPPPPQLAPKEAVDAMVVDGQDDNDEDEDEPERPHVRIGDRMPEES